ncbi:MAG: DUF2279 domain-containing protein [Sphingobacteriales bacterium]|nr:MAG: DUF2279 domain-containing protein [Sphingobacteriales bacterium]
MPLIKNKLILTFTFLVQVTHGYTQNNTTSNPPVFHRDRFTGVLITETITGLAITLGLNYLWYKKFPHSRFHFFNDNSEWLGMDKAGHATTAYNIAAVQNDIMRWTGMRPGTAALTGSLTALCFMTMIELMDGHSAKWGFSKGDMVANISGCLLFQLQQWAWHEQRIELKYSFHKTIFPRYNSDELGKNIWQQMLKDYNGQTYWLSFNIASFLPASYNVPKWLNVTAGYGAEGMTGARFNPTFNNGNKLPSFERYHQYYLGLDTDLFRINNLTEFTRSLLKINRTIKLPACVYEWDSLKKQKKFIPFYF